MQIRTKYHGEISVNRSEVFVFKQGIPAFLEEENFVFLPLSDDGIYFIMQSVKTPELAFLVISPFTFFKEYDFMIEDSIVSELSINAEEDILVYSILTVEDPFEKTTANLQAPIVVNTKNRTGKQVILHNEIFGTKHRIFQYTK
ncbi:flagellar assembly protein FliW [Mesobacillus jeotgali]|uniref:Flagellar assembly factor FliW n=1 Tax=Mesobacillus jeotgali TaxID=129985 RepID=A0ABY9VFA3_9BACI|nr:flagellar assembly protein FliW [Mesobacillus jeotgali]WNF22614.1 flagellar assembly protein FliW [Mesobacillus jeotgali]